MKIRLITNISKPLPMIEEEDNTNAVEKEKVFQLVKQLFQATASSKQLLESYTKKNDLAVSRTKKIKQAKTFILNSCDKLDKDIKSLNKILKDNIKKLTDAIQGGISSYED